MLKICYSLLGCLFVTTVFALSPLKKKEGFLEHKKQQLNYEKKKEQDFKKYKKSYRDYKNRENKIREKRLKDLSKIRKFRKEEIKKQKLEKKWKKQRDRAEKNFLKVKERYIQKRTSKHKEKRRHSIHQEFEGISK